MTERKIALSIEEAADYTGIGRNTLRKLVEWKKTPFGHSVPVYDMERTICDLLRSRNNIEMQVFQDALKQYARRKDKNLRTLMKYASMFHVEKILRPYLEVLL